MLAVDETSAAAAADVAVNEDLLPEILLRVPLKPLARAKCVSKHWRSLISSPIFSLRLNPIPKPPSGIFLQRSYLLNYGCPANSIPKPSYLPLHDDHNHTDPINPLAFFNQNPSVFIFQSCNGLLSCFDYVNCNYFVVNPTTKQSRNLNVPDLENCLAVNIAFDPLRSPHYKAICVKDPGISTQSTKYLQIGIYSSETSSWRPSGETSTVPVPVGVSFNNIQFSAGVFWNGAINWITNAGGESLYFSVEQERIHTMPMPHPFSQEVSYFGESGDHLHLVEFDGSQGVEKFRIYEMERDYSGWVVRYSVTLDDVRAAYPEMVVDTLGSLFSIFCLLRRENGNEDESLLVLQHHVNGKVIRYNLMAQKPFKKFLDLDPEESMKGCGLIWFTWYNVYEYIESVASV